MSEPLRTPETSGEIHLNHFLVEHSRQSAPAIAEAMNQDRYDVIYVEMCTDEATQAFHGNVYQSVINREVRVDPALVPDRDAMVIVMAGLNQAGARVVPVDKSFDDRLKAGLPPNATSEDFFQLVYNRGLHNRLREPYIVEQISSDLRSHPARSTRAALITGQQHTYPSAELSRRGVEVVRTFVGGELNPGEQTVLPGERFRFSPIVALIRAIRYGLDEQSAREKLEEIRKTL